MHYAISTNTENFAPFDDDDNADADDDDADCICFCFNNICSLIDGLAALTPLPFLETAPMDDDADDDDDDVVEVFIPDEVDGCANAVTVDEADDEANVNVNAGADVFALEHMRCSPVTNRSSHPSAAPSLDACARRCIMVKNASSPQALEMTTMLCRARSRPVALRHVSLPLYK